MKFSKLAIYLENLEKTASRIKITEILAELFKNSDKEEIDKIVNLILGRLAPSYENIVFNFADRLMLHSISKAYTLDISKARTLYKQKGDLGDVVETLASKDIKGTMDVARVYKKLVRIAKEQGEGSQERKIDETADLLKKLDPKSAKYTVRIILGKLRLGFSDKTVLDALSWMLKNDKSIKKDLEKLYHITPDAAHLAKSIKTQGLQKALINTTAKVGIPILPMLAQRLKSPEEMIEKMGRVAVEPKFDGLRIQIHFQNNPRIIKAFTRNLNEVSWMFPELEKIKDLVSAKSAVLDTEAIGISEDRKKLANFQTTMTRRRKHEINKFMNKVPIRFYVFDILVKNDKSLLDLSYIKRREALNAVVSKQGLLVIDDFVLTSSPNDIRKEMKKSLNLGLEGIIVKKANSSYMPGRTGWRWVKMKEEESSRAKLADTVDCVIMGYTLGKGKRASFGIGQFLVGIQDKNQIKTITKVGTGITDEKFHYLNKLLKPLKTKNKPQSYLLKDKNLTPDYWVEPKILVELAADEITVSPTHSSGFALRFPRMVKIRDDKSPEEATTIKEIKELYKMQNKR